MAAGIWDWNIEQGSDFDPELTLTTQEDPPQPINLTGYTIRAQIRPNLSRDTAILYELTTENERLRILDGPAGKVSVYIPAEDSTLWTWTEGVYDLELVSPGGRPRRLLKGVVRVDPEVTR
uniref:hypothetical protein n=1 Tax=Streptosporangium sp. CA-235898 TaxID=3240073 RepID=UPI003F49255E